MNKITTSPTAGLCHCAGLAVVCLLLFVSALPAAAQMHINYGKNSPLRKLQIAELAINNLYVDSVDEGRLVEDGIRGMIEKLDPHSSYSTAKETKAMNESLNGSFDGIGVQFNMQEDTLLVIQTILKGPSERAGILAGDRIVAVNDTAIAGVKMAREEIMRRLRGPKGTKVKLTIVRRGIKDKLTFNVTRDKIPVKTIDGYYMIRPQVGYIRIGSFGATTYKEFMTAVGELRAKGMRDLILDLQDNGGGYLQAAVQIANEFLQPKDLIVYTEGRKFPRQEYHAQDGGSLREGKVVVLVNEFTASAAEIVTGAIQDQDRGLVVGRRTFGKGLVQRPVEFEDGSMMRLTIAHYYTPSGRCIQKPYTKGDKKDYSMDLDQRYKHGEFYSADSIHFADSLKYYTLRKHRTVYGGGGIMPDFFEHRTAQGLHHFLHGLLVLHLGKEASIAAVAFEVTECKEAVAVEVLEEGFGKAFLFGAELSFLLQQRHHLLGDFFALEIGGESHQAGFGNIVEQFTVDFTHRFRFFLQ